ncbi:carbonic anhydrase 4a [Lampris incognitus]|uniref:carbonic anhydrase 4a n=1 Tax=Lampris incognitus TaxID=2546036 RepID=UPI0024B5BE48|nr:carbonic anhydrase 4a [Lampris incognitus]
MQRLLLLILTSLLAVCTGSGDWCYQPHYTCEPQCNAPEKWDHANRGCSGKAQSPINIVTRKTLKDDRLTAFHFSNYQHFFTGSIINNGHSAQVGVTHLATIAGGDLGVDYKVVQFHFHWGNSGGPGSEHTIDGERYPMELHIVHMKQKYTDIKTALSDPTGIAVLGFLYEESSSANRKYEPIISALKSIKAKNGNTTLRSISLGDLIPPQHNLTNYYRYKGSLTTPPCSEAVVWTVFENPIPLSKEQLKAFSELQFHDGKAMVDNFRPVQPLNARRVYRSGGTAVLASVAILLASVTTALGLSHPN